MREIETLNDKRKEETKIKSKLMMEFGAEHVEANSGSIAEFQKMNKARKCKRAMLPRESIESSVVVLKSCDRGMSEVSNVRNALSRGTEARRYINHKKTTKSCSKVRSKFI